MTAGQLETVILDTDYGISAVLGWPDDKYQGKFRQPEACWQTTSYRGSDAPLPPVEECKNFPDIDVAACHGGDPTAGYIFCNDGSNEHLPDSIGLLGREGDGYSAYEATYNRAHAMTTGFP
jgi:hypothetical protein